MFFPDPPSDTGGSPVSNYLVEVDDGKGVLVQTSCSHSNDLILLAGYTWNRSAGLCQNCSRMSSYYITMQLLRIMRLFCEHMVPSPSDARHKCALIFLCSLFFIQCLPADMAQPAMSVFMCILHEDLCYS